MLESLSAKTGGRAKEAVPVVAVILFLAFVGFSVYLNPTRWDVECVGKDSSGKLASTVRAHPANERALERFMAAAEKRGETCKMIPSRRR